MGYTLFASVVASAIALSAGSALAGSSFVVRTPVIGIEPRYDTVSFNEPVEVCDRVESYQDNSGVGTVLGGVAGGVVGHELADKKHRTEGAIVGGLLGAVVGNQVGQNNSGYRTKEYCRVEYRTAKKRTVVGYLVTTKVAGKVVTIPMDHNPGKRVAVRISVSAAE